MKIYTLIDTITLFSKINAGRALNGHSVVPFSAEPSVVEYYEEQMLNLDMDPQEIEEFRAWLLALGH